MYMCLQIESSPACTCHYRGWKSYRQCLMRCGCSTGMSKWFHHKLWCWRQHKCIYLWCSGLLLKRGIEQGWNCHQTQHLKCRGWYWSKTHFWPLLKITGLKMKVDPRSRIGKDTGLHIQRSQVACVRFEDSEVAVLSADFGMIKGAHGSANVLVSVYFIVRSVDVIVPATVCQISWWDHGRQKYSICSCCGKVWTKISLNLSKIRNQLMRWFTYTGFRI